MKKYLVGLILGISGLVMIGSDVHANCRWTIVGCQPPQRFNERTPHRDKEWFGFCYNDGILYCSDISRTSTRQEIIDECGRMGWSMAWASRDANAVIHQYKNQCTRH